MNIRKFITQVDAFHVAFRYKQPTPVAPDLSDATTNELRVALLREELDELHQAIADNSRVGQLDALCDLQYVHSGAVLAWGFRPLFENTRLTMELRKIRDMEGHLAAMARMLSMLEVHAEMGFAHQVFSGLCVLQSRLATTVFHLGFSECFVDAFAEVNRSNMTKLWTENEVTDSWNDALTFEKSEGGYIARRADGKIMKSPSYSPADLVRFV